MNKAAVLRSNLAGSRARFEDMVRHINAVKLRPVINKVGKMVIKVSKN